MVSVKNRRWIMPHNTKQKLQEIKSRLPFPVMDLLLKTLINRGYQSPEKILTYLKPHFLQLPSPFLFNDMAKAVKRILDGIKEGHTILIFGDKDVDGVTATSLLYKTLHKLKANVVFRVPEGDDKYGLSADIIQWAASEGLDLIITVDCGITAIEEVKLASKLGLDIIITDHHEPRQQLPEAFAVINPKVAESGYPFPFLSGASVAMNLAWALLEAHFLHEYHNQELIFCDLETTGLNPSRDEIIEIGAVKVKNGVILDTFQCFLKTEKPLPKEISRLTGITQEMLEKEGLPPREALEKFFAFAENKKIIGHNLADFDMRFLQHALRKYLGKHFSPPIEDTLRLSKILFPKLKDHKLSTLAEELGIYIDTSQLHRASFDAELCAKVYRSMILQRNHPLIQSLQDIMSLAAIGTIADIMPLIEENRTIVKNGLEFVRYSSIGLIKLIQSQQIPIQKVSVKDIGWGIAPMLNSPGRVGQASISVELLLSSKIHEVDELLSHIVNKDNERRQQFDNNLKNIEKKLTPETIDETVIILESHEISKNSTGLLSNKLSLQYQKPVVVIAVQEKEAIGSVRSAVNFNVIEMLEHCSDLLSQFGGHKAAGGFTISNEKLPIFKERVLEYYEKFQQEATPDKIPIDLEIDRLSDITLDNLRYLETMMEPIGTGNELPRIFISKVKLANPYFFGKQKDHFQCFIIKGDVSLPAVGWAFKETLMNFGFDKFTDQWFDIVAVPEINRYNGTEQVRLNLVDIALHPYERGDECR
ncbi:MAG: single-stranded-DNA-specific exonuclease RecJ [Brevinematales bacterium]|nr:single-stranded-DNA-specific exonuclease RecJ [Brevinematales bacterium]